MSNEIPLFGDEKPSPNNQKQKKVILTGVSIVIIALVLIIAIKLVSGPSSNEPGENISSELTQKLNQSFVVDNDIRNAFNSKILGVSEQYLFYSDNNALYRINKDGSNKLELDTGKISNINVYQDTLYYSRTDITDDTRINRNANYQIVKISFDGKNKKTITSYDCQRISSVLLVNDIVLFEPIVFIPDGNSNDRGEDTGAFETRYFVSSLDGTDVSQLPDDSHNTKFALKRPYNQSELDSFLAIDYPNTIVKSSRYSINDTLYFDTQSIEQPKTSRLFSISKDNDTLNLIGEHTPETIPDTPGSLYLNGFAYDGEYIFYILTERRATDEKYDLYKIDLNSNSTLFVETLYNPGGF